MTILSYGEDAFTLHALKYGLDRILAALDDPTAPDDALVLFRPSFGRRSTAPTGRPRAEFGEPDAIVGTPHRTYIVEAKWSASGERDGDVVVLREEQIRRHRILRAYIETWRLHASPEDWEGFAAAVRRRFDAEGLGVVPPRPDTRLAETLRFVLTRLADCGKVRDVLLYCHPDREPEVPKLQCEGFEVVQYACPALEGSHFVLLDGALGVAHAEG